MITVKATVNFSLRLIGSAIYSTTFNQVTRVGLPYFFLLKDDSLQINS